MASHNTFITLILLSLLTLSQAATINVINRCSYTVWGAAVPGGGRQLNPGASWSFNVASGTTSARVWARTGCSFDQNGNGRCQTGDCGGKLACTGYGSPPNTLARCSLNQWRGLDYIDISLVDGFNVPLNVIPTSNGCSSGPQCSADVNAQCPSVLRTAGGCNNPCTTFKTEQYCCNSGNACPPTAYSQYFKGKCPQAYSYPKDDHTPVFTCPGNTNYQVVFCP